MLVTDMFRSEGGGEVKYHAQPGDNILEIAQKAGVSVDAPCGGNGTCGKCKMRIMAGSVNYNKGGGKLSDEDYEIMKNHTTAGSSIINKAITFFIVKPLNIAKHLNHTSQSSNHLQYKL